MKSMSVLQLIVLFVLMFLSISLFQMLQLSSEIFFLMLRKLVVLNVACYEANALLPNGENAHITVRNPHWWKGVLDLISVEFPSISVDLICSPKYDKMLAFPTFSDEQRQADDKFCIAY